MGFWEEEIASLSSVERSALALLIAVVIQYPESLRLSSPNNRNDNLSGVVGQVFDLLCDDLRLG